MLPIVKEWGKKYLEKENLEEKDFFLDYNDLSNIHYVIKVVLSWSEGELKFDYVSHEDFKNNIADKYLYKKYRGNQWDFTLTSKVDFTFNSKVDSAKKLSNRWGSWFFDFAEPENFWNSNLVKSIYSCMADQSGNRKKDKKLKDIIVKEIEKEFQKFTGKQKILCTVKIKENGSEKYLGEKYVGDFDVFKQILVDESKKNFYQKKDNTKSIGVGTCYLCNEHREVYGFASPFLFSTVNEPGFAPELSQENTWKHQPICENCAIYLTAGKSFIDTYLKYNLYNYRYYVIPQLLLDEPHLKSDIFDKINHYSKKSYQKGLLNEEDPTFGLFQNIEGLNLNFVFLKEEQNKSHIIKSVEETPPSWLYEMEETMKKTNEKTIFQEESLQQLLGTNWTSSFRQGKLKGKERVGTHLAGIINEFFSDKDFIEVIGNIVGKQPVSKSLLMNAFIKRISSAHRNNNSWQENLLCLKSLMLLLYLTNLKLLKEGDSLENKYKLYVDSEETSDSKEGEKKVESFLDEFKEALNTPDKRSAFLEGVLAKFLLDIQFRKRGGTPFRSKLHSLNLDERKLKRLLPEIEQKLYEYEMGGAYQWLKKKLSHYMLEADKVGWSSKDELSYFFALGLNLGSTFKDKSGEKRGE